MGLRRTNLQKDFEAYGKYTLVEQAKGGSPLALAFRGGFATVRDKGFGNRSRWHAQWIASRRLWNRLSLMLVPTYVSRANFEEETDNSGTTALGLGGQLRLRRNIALTGEWIGQVGGVEAPFTSTSIGLSLGSDRHVFHLLVTNTRGTHTDLFSPGGDLDFGGGGTSGSASISAGPILLPEPGTGSSPRN